MVARTWVTLAPYVLALRACRTMAYEEALRVQSPAEL